MPETPEHDLVALSQFAAGDVLLVQGGGGNTSAKSPDGKRMWIKASGLRLDELSLHRGYLETDVAALLAVVRDPGLAALPRAAAHEAAVERTQRAVAGNGRLRPSLETTFHAVLGQAVLHTHPVYVNAFTCMVGGEAALAETLGAQTIWVPYAAPGLALGREVDRLAQAHQAATGRAPQHIVLGNHGLIASGATPAEAIDTTERLLEAGRRYFGPVPHGACSLAAPPAGLERWARQLQKALARQPGRPASYVRVSRRAALLEAANDAEQWLCGRPLVPDDVVYNGRTAFPTEIATPPQDWLAGTFERAPARMVVAVRGQGVVLVGPSRRTVEAMEENLLAHVLVRWLIAAQREEVTALPAEEIDYLLGMESEKYRQAVAAKA